MNDTKYNGWTNYATWRVNLEMFDGFDLSDIACPGDDGYDIAQQLRSYAEEIICISATDGLAKDYALAFVSDVNWREIAQHMIADYADA